MNIDRILATVQGNLPSSLYATGELPDQENPPCLFCDDILDIGESLFVPGYGIRDWLYDLLGLPPANRPDLTDTGCGSKRKGNLKLLPDLLIAKGRNRYVFAFPGDPSTCIKIDRPWGEGLFNSRKWRRKRALGSWFADFSPNREELRYYCRQIRRIGERFYDHAPRFYGLVISNLGPGMVFERFCSPGSDSSQGLYQFLKGRPTRKDLAVRLVDELYTDLMEKSLTFFDWQTANLVVHKTHAGKLRIVVVDWKSGGRCNSDNPINHYVPFLAERRFKTHFEELRSRILDGRLNISTAALLTQSRNVPGDLSVDETPVV